MIFSYASDKYVEKDIFNLFFQACLSCSNVACGRLNEQHAEKHFKATQVSQ